MHMEPIDISEVDLQNHNEARSPRDKVTRKRKQNNQSQREGQGDVDCNDDWSDDSGNDKRSRLGADISTDKDDSTTKDDNKWAMSEEEAERKRILANSQERERMNKLNSALAALRRVLPADFCVATRRLSKIRTLRLAIRYIRGLTELLAEDDAGGGPGQHQHPQPHPAWTAQSPDWPPPTALALPWPQYPPYPQHHSHPHIPQDSRVPPFPHCDLYPPAQQEHVPPVMVNQGQVLAQSWMSQPIAGVGHVPSAGHRGNLTLSSSDEGYFSSSFSGHPHKSSSFLSDSDQTSSSVLKDASGLWLGEPSSPSPPSCLLEGRSVPSFLAEHDDDHPGFSGSPSTPFPLQLSSTPFDRASFRLPSNTHLTPIYNGQGFARQHDSYSSPQVYNTDCQWMAASCSDGYRCKEPTPGRLEDNMALEIGSVGFEEDDVEEIASCAYECDSARDGTKLIRQQATSRQSLQD